MFRASLRVSAPYTSFAPVCSACSGQLIPVTESPQSADLVLCCVGQDTLGAGAAALEVTGGLRARNIRDMRLFLNLADFLAALLPAAGSRLFRPWAHVLTTELQVGDSGT